MTEEELAREVIAECRILDVHVFRVPRVRLSMAGFPDLVLWGRGGLILRELKSDDGRCSRRQEAVGRSLLAAGQDWGIWRPEHYRRGLIAHELVRLACG